MKLGLVLCLTIMLVFSINIVSVQACTYCPADLSPQDSARFQQEFTEKTQEALKHQIQVNQDQRLQDLQIIVLLIAISIGLSCALIALIVIFFKNRKWYRKPNPES